MNGWVRKEGKLNEKYRVTASGARHLVVVSTAAPTMETTHDGSTWGAVALTAKPGGRHVHAVEVNGELLGSHFRLTAGDATFYYYLED